MSDLPPNVAAVRDRHGKIRYRFRRKGWKSAYLPGTPGTAEFHKAYAAVIERGAEPGSRPLSASFRPPVTPRSLDDLAAKVRQSTRWQRKAGQTRHVQSRIIERFLARQDSKGRRYGERPVTKVTVAWLDRIFAGMSETPAAANTLRKILAGLMDHAIRMGWRTDNPVRITESYKEGDGHHTWTEEEIEQYRACHPLGTMARLVLELALNTAARKCNITRLTRDDIVNQRITVDHVKGGNRTSVPMLATTRAALDALPAAPIRHLVVTEHGKPFTAAGMGNRMRKWCDDAGLKNCTMHGLRKATSRRIAESGGTDAEGQAITGHRKAAMFAYYREKADRTRLADAAMSNLASAFDTEIVQPQKNEGKSSV